MISFHQFINLKEALSIDDPLAQSILQITDKYPETINFEFKIDNDEYQITFYKVRLQIEVENYQTLDTVNLMEISLKVNGSFKLTNKMGMQANTVYNMLLNAMKQANDHFGENNINGYTFVGAQSQQNIMYDRLMKRFAPNLITWDYLIGIYLKPETIQKLKDKNPDKINQINNHIHQATSQKEISIQQAKEYKNYIRSQRRQQP
jgi:hypothetical protein